MRESWHSAQRFAMVRGWRGCRAELCRHLTSLTTTKVEPGARGHGADARRSGREAPRAACAGAVFERACDTWRARVDLVSSEALSTLLLGARGPVIEGAGETETVREPGVSVRHFAFPLACFRSGCRALVGAPWRQGRFGPTQSLSVLLHVQSLHYVVVIA